jgi:hypothetical protein
MVGRLALLALVLLAAPGGVAAKKPKAKPEPTLAPADNAMHIEGTLGELDAGQVERLFRDNQPALRKCYDKESADLHYLGGRLEVKVVVAPSGQPKSVTLDSSLGCFEVERCMATIIEKLKFPQPKGGDGEVTYPFEAAARTPVGSWQAPRISATVAKKKGPIRACPGVAKAMNLRATLYVGPGGKATSVGFSADSPLDDKLVRCVSKQLLALQYDDPLGQMVKVSYDFKDLP